MIEEHHISLTLIVGRKIVECYVFGKACRLKSENEGAASGLQNGAEER